MATVGTVGTVEHLKGLCRAATPIRVGGAAAAVVRLPAYRLSSSGGRDFGKAAELTYYGRRLARACAAPPPPPPPRRWQSSSACSC